MPLEARSRTVFRSAFTPTRRLRRWRRFSPPGARSTASPPRAVCWVRISASASADALRAVTLGSAYTLHIDDEVGSIEVGKRADFAVLADDPLKVPPEALKDVRVVGTMVGGVPFETPAAT